jgi:bifunctional non-homologous end joining protein LigD
MPKVRDALKALPTDVWLDGEAVVLDANSHPDFNALQNAFDRRSSARVVLYVFDLLWIGGSDIREQPLVERRRRSFIKHHFCRAVTNFLPQDVVGA